MAIAITKVKLWKLIEAFAKARADAYYARDQDTVSNADAADILCVQAEDALSAAINKKVTLRVHAYALGDRVGVRPTSQNTAAWRLMGEASAIVTASQVAADGSISYALDGCAWFPHKDLILMNRATRFSLKQVHDLSKEEEEGEDEEGDA